jgi:hypothetical protein
MWQYSLWGIGVLAVCTLFHNRRERDLYSVTPSQISGSSSRVLVEIPFRSPTSRGFAQNRL